MTTGDEMSSRLQAVRRAAAQTPAPIGSGALMFRTKAEIAYAELRRRIISGELPPGEHLNQEQLAEHLGVSTTPLREALRRLESDGFILSTAHREVAVAPVDLARTADLYEAKEALECYAARLAAQRATPADHRRMLDALEGLRRRRTIVEDPAWSANRVVHEAIYTSAHNSVLTEFLNVAWDQYERFRQVQNVIWRDPMIEGEHEEIVRAVIDRRSGRAERLMRDHLRHARDYIASELERIKDVRT